MSGKAPPAILAYMAGIIDGEGCFIIARNRGIRGRSAREYVFQSRVTVNIREREIPDLFVTWFGGKTRVHREATETTAKMWYWSLNGGPSFVDFVTQIYPYLIIKRRQAELVLAFQELKEVIGCKRITDEAYERSCAFYTDIRMLNLRGPLKP